MTDSWEPFDPPVPDDPYPTRYEHTCPECGSHDIPSEIMPENPMDEDSLFLCERCGFSGYSDEWDEE